MTHQLIEYRDWTIDVYYNVSQENTSCIIDRLTDIDCSREYLHRVYDLLESNPINSGFTFANIKTKEIVVVVCEADSSDEFLDTLMHELYHCSDFISDNSDDLEYSAYILGDLSKKVYKVVHKYICCKCK